MATCKKYTGYTEATMNNRATGAGAYFKNYNVETDTVTSAIEAGKLIGATQGGGTFTAAPTYRDIQVDGILGMAKGLKEIDAWAVTLTANVLEITADNIKESLGAATITEPANPVNYRLIKGKPCLDAVDYTDNITFIGNLSGFDRPVIIQVFNTLSTSGMSYGATDGSDTVLPMSWTGHYDGANTDSPPFAVYIPVEPPAAGGGN